MAIPTITGYTGVIPDRRTQSAEEFTSAAVTWTDYQSSILVPSTNAAINGINAAQDEILDSVNNAEESSFIAQAAANYQGPWFSGASVVKGESWSHNGLMWAANITGAGEPQENAQWFLLKSEPELSAIKVMLEQWGYRYVGLFDDGFTYSQIGDAGVDDNNNAWIYVGAGAPNKAVGAGTVPSVEWGYEQVVFNVRGTPPLVMPSNEIPASNLLVGDLIIATDRGGSKFEVVSSGVADGFGVIAMDNGLFAKVSIEYTNKLAAYGDGTDAFISASENAGINNTLHLPYGENEGTFVFQNQEVKGEGTGTILKGASDIAPTVTIKRKPSTEDWDFWKISDLKIYGKSAASKACVQFDPTDPFAGRAVFDNVSFRDAVSGVDKASGNIGDGYYLCNFQSLDYGWTALSSANPLMHSGAVVFEQTNFDVIDRACIIVRDEVEGPGGLVVRDSLMQSCNGFGAFINYNNFVPINPPVFDNVWMEQIALSPTTNIYGVDYDTRQLRFEDTVYSIVRATYVYSAELVNSTVRMSDCRIDGASAPTDFAIDNSSVLIVDDMYGNGEVGDKPFVRSIARQTNKSGQLNLSVRGPWKTNQIRLSSMGNATNVLSNSFSGTGPWGFVGSSGIDAVTTNDGVLNDTCGEITIPAGETVISDISGTPTLGSWVVWGIHAKQVTAQGPTIADIGHQWIAGNIYLKQGEWVCSYGIQQVGSDFDECRIRLHNTSGSATTIRLADFFVIQFTTYKEAFEFVNSGYAIKNEI